MLGKYLFIFFPAYVSIRKRGNVEAVLLYLQLNLLDKKVN